NVVTTYPEARTVTGEGSGVRRVSVGRVALAARRAVLPVSATSLVSAAVPSVAGVSAFTRVLEPFKDVRSGSVRALDISVSRRSRTTLGWVHQSVDQIRASCQPRDFSTDSRRRSRSRAVFAL